ncbi:hypothetical protein C499_06700 [Halogeometricum borinquense DSM 11551]|uniref:DUF8160 domain-containing protein n=1 Tax=Halogeometricum borinquense (strain ATCC 700274 / DSM 11551 / JCM 10706 / KCTC 4070 / PR3) TaxID=469382 RepID=E4NUY2_HALBP|nr:hypothetical protein [Halogeometricum borinquense]ADQ68971.1 hypothetical protein Hbor_34500 [Halogeometricum borinquense DSM 11551]ELY29206.1 hypothetical protein C499_06700 [Halogeometricum borinquense DSM 11551]
MSGEDRADRLRRRRQRARDRARTDESNETEETDKSEETDKTGESAKTAEAAETAKLDETAKTEETAEKKETEATDETDEPKESVKDVQKPTYMYLPHSVRRDLDRAYSMLKAEYEYEYQEGFEKNRHFYPLVVSLGLEAIEELDPEDVRARLNENQ